MPFATVMLWQDKLSKTNVPSTAQNLFPEALTTIDALKVFPTVLVKFAGETYKEGAAAAAVPTKITADKKTIADNMIFVVLFFMFIFLFFYNPHFDINKAKSYLLTLPSLFKSQLLDPVFPQLAIIKEKSYLSTLLSPLVSPILAVPRTI